MTSQLPLGCSGTYLEGSSHGKALAATMASVLSTEVNSVLYESAKGKKVIEKFFNVEKFEVALADMKNEIRTQRFGYDEDEEVSF